MSALRQGFLKAIYPFLKFIGDLHLPYTRKKITADDVEHILTKLKVGDVLCSTAYGEISNIFIGGKHKHASVYIGNGRVVEAVGKGVRELNIYQALMTRDVLSICRSKEATPEQLAKIPDLARSLKGIPYDYDFYVPEPRSEQPNEKFYCAEMVWYVHRKVNPDTKFKLREVWGVQTIIPDDFTYAKKYWDVVLYL